MVVSVLIVIVSTQYSYAYVGGVNPSGALPSEGATTLQLKPRNVDGGDWTITGYCACVECCGEWALNRPVDEDGNEIVYGASGRRLESGYSCATNSLPLGTLIEIEGLGVWRVDDHGTVGIDLYYDTHERASLVGCQTRQVTILGGEDY